MDLDEPIKLSPHDPSWLDLAFVERRRVASALGIPLGDIEHIGSTAVPSLVAKPIIDLMVGVEFFPPADTLIEALRALDYESLGEAGVTGRLYFRRRIGMPFNLHVVAKEGDHWRTNLAFRELLRRNPASRDRYAQTKTQALESGRKTLLEYSDAKGAVIRELMREG